MVGKNRNRIGTIGWLDISVQDAPRLRDFYAEVIGWLPEDVSMGDHNDYNMTLPASGEPAAGVCHARGSNADLPPRWLVYIIVEDVDKSAESCVANGGTLVNEPRGLAGGRFCVIRDPVGAVLALYQEAD